MIKKAWLVISLFILLALSVWVFGLSVQAEENFSSPFAQNEIIVKLKPEIAEERMGELNRRLNTKLGRKLLQEKTFVLELPERQVERFIRVLERLPEVEYAEPNYKAYTLFAPNDPYFPQQWGMTKVESPAAWEIASGSTQVKVAILDTGIDQDHEDLGDKIVLQKNFTSSSTLDDLYGHGTHVAGIAAAVTNNTIGVAGLGFHTSLVSGKVLGDDGSGYYSWVADGIRWAADNGAKVINLSLGGSGASKTLENAVKYAWSKGVVLACAAGNSNNKSPTYPGYYTNCIATAATNAIDQKASFSSYGKWVDVAAPGVDIFSTFPNHDYKIGKAKGYDYANGTSMAAPHVAGLAGLIFGQDLTLSANEVRRRIEETADKISGTGTYWAKGRINAYKAVFQQTTTETPTLTPTPILTSTPTPTPTISQPTPSPTPTPRRRWWR